MLTARFPRCRATSSMCRAEAAGRAALGRLKPLERLAMFLKLPVRTDAAERRLARPERQRDHGPGEACPQMPPQRWKVRRAYNECRCGWNIFRAVGRWPE